MNNHKPKTALHLGIFILSSGIAGNKWVLEHLLSPDGRIESRQIAFTIAMAQLSLISIGIFLIAKKPHINTSLKKEFSLAAASILISILLAEAALRVWLSHFSTQEQQSAYALFTDIPPEHRTWSPHHYLNYYPTPNYRKGLTYHNSLGYRSREFNPNKRENIYRIVTIGGSTTYTISVEDNDKTFPYQLEHILQKTLPARTPR